MDNYCPLSKRDGNRAVVGAINVSVDFCFLDMLHEFLCDKKIIDAPTDVSIACMESHVPIAIGIFGVRMKMTKRINISGVQYLVDPCAFLW